jgi:hypothetical protein
MFILFEIEVGPLHPSTPLLINPLPPLPQVDAPTAPSGQGTPDPLLALELQPHKELDVGHLPNGLRYVILPNKAPPNRFEAHLEIHAGSVDEEANEQGIAHLVEHVTFLGSKKREALLGTGARSNAYTDFHHTVFHVHAPEQNANTGDPMLWQVRASTRAPSRMLQLPLWESVCVCVRRGRG